MKRIKLFSSLSIFTIVVILFLHLSDLYAQDKLAGTWERRGDDLEGEQVKVTKNSAGEYEGTLIKLPAIVTDYCFQLGTVRWTNIRQSANGFLQMDDATSAKPDCDIRYDYMYINFTEENKISVTRQFGASTSGSNFQTWVKISN